MSKIIILILIFLNTFSTVLAELYCPEDWWSCYEVDELKDMNDTVSTSKCSYDEWASLSSFLNGCKPSSVVGASDMKVEKWFKEKVKIWITNLSVFLWVMAVGSLVYAAFLMQISGWEDEQIKKGKNIIKHTILGFLGLITASGIIYLVVNVMFWLWS